ncbi:MAG: hypothetical protein ABSH20_23755 [Tepidisphaeraceae bacterium]|jgi:hypothetical protein
MSEAPKEKEKKVVPGMLVSGDIVAGGGRYYRNARFIIVVMFLLWGLWSIRDGFYKYPRERDATIQKYVQRFREEMHREPTTEDMKAIREGNPIPHQGNYDILFNVVLGVLLPPASLLVLAWTLYNSRGEYRLSEATLHVPGHPPIPLDAIHKLDKTLWDRKGIAIIEYELPDGKAGVVKMDDFIYAQDPTDAIMDHIEACLAERSGDGVHEITDAPKEEE